MQKLGDTLRRMDIELSAHIPPQMREPLNAWDYDVAFPGTSLAQDILYDLLKQSAQVAYHGRPHPAITPDFEITRRSLALAGHNESQTMPARGAIYDVACFEAELRFARSLRWHTLGQTPDAEHKPAAIFRDVRGQPAAYQKASGMATAYVWRDSLFQTAGGPRFAPADSLVEFTYDLDAEAPAGGPQDYHLGSGLIDVRGGWVPPELSFLRFAANCLPDIARDEVLNQGVQAVNKLQTDVLAARSLTGGYIAAQVHKLLQSDLVTPVHETGERDGQ